MSNAKGGQNNTGDDAKYIFFAIFFCGIVFLTWMFLRPVIVYPLFVLDYIAIKIMEYTTGLGDLGTQSKNYVEGVLFGHINIKEDVNFSDFTTVRYLVGNQTKWVYGAVIVFFAYLALKKMKGNTFRRVFTLGSSKKDTKNVLDILTDTRQPIGFNQFQAEFWQIASTSAYFDPFGRDQDILPSLTPMDWMKEHKIEFENNVLDMENEEKCIEKFTDQLDERWKGINNAKPHQQAIAILCALHYMKRSDNVKFPAPLYERERMNLSIAFAGRKDGTPAIKKLIATYLNDEKVQIFCKKFLDQHAFTNTALIRGLVAARSNDVGILPSSHFLWLRYVDRTLHYCLNNVGRAKFFIEGAGAISHYHAEMILKQPLHSPHVEHAVKGLTIELDIRGIDSLSEYWEYKKHKDNDIFTIEKMEQEMRLESQKMEMLVKDVDTKVSHNFSHFNDVVYVEND